MGGPTGGNQDREAEHWLAQLRDGAPAQKAEARSQLAAIFERLGMTNEAVELLVANARAGYRSPDLFETLARLYRALGNEYLSASAALEAARLRERGTTPPHPGASPGSGRPPGSHGGARYAGQYGPSARAQPHRGPSGPTPPGGQTSRNRWEQPLRAGGWVVFAGTLMAAIAVAGTSPVAAVGYAVAAAALGMLLAGATGLRQPLRVPTGPLGDGILMFVALLLFLIGGALLPRNTEPPSATAPQARTPGPLYLGTPTPAPGASPSTPAQSIPPTASPAASPAAASQVAPSPGNEQTSQVTPTANDSVSSPVPAPSQAAVPSTTQTGDLGARVRIASVGIEGVRLRPEPGSPEILKVLTEGTLLESLGEEQEDGGRQWRRVRDQEGLVGWVAADFLAAEPATPTVVVAAPSVTPAAQAALVRPPPATSAPSTPPTLSTPPPPPEAPTPPPTSPPEPTEPPRPATTTPVPPTVQVAAAKPQVAATATRAASAATPRPAAPAPVARTAPSGMDCPSGQPIKGNHSQPSGEWIYHVPGGQFYRATKPEECFATADDARRAGYRPSQR